MPHDKTTQLDELYDGAVSDASADDHPAPPAKDNVAASNSSNYGGSALTDTSLEERVLKDD